MIEFLLDTFRSHRDDEAVVWNGEVCTYGDLLAATQRWSSVIREGGYPRGTVAAIEADFSPNSIALFLALTEHGCTVVPLTSTVESKKPEFMDVAQVELLFTIAADDEYEIHATLRRADHPYYITLRERGAPGLVLFSSGSTGRSKAAVHDLGRLLDKFHTQRNRLRTITFLLYDHIGGVNTLLYTLSNAGCVITVQDRTPDAVMGAVERHRAELLPTSPTFLNLLLLSDAWRRHDVSSLKVITYGTEPMPESTLKRLHRALPDVKLQQTYGLSELGILRSKSRDSQSLWVKVGGEGFETRVVDGVLWIRARSAMLGYLNHESPFDAEGWFNTGDEVEVEGEYIRFLGRRTEIINVGGEKVHPVEVESVLQTMDGVLEAAVSSEPNPITGQIVKAVVQLSTAETGTEFRKRMRTYCRDKLALFKIPQRVIVTQSSLHSGRFKKMRLDGST